jgi:hypothetical protein
LSARLIKSAVSFFTSSDVKIFSAIAWTVVAAFIVKYQEDFNAPAGLSSFNPAGRTPRLFDLVPSLRFQITKPPRIKDLMRRPNSI